MPTAQVNFGISGVGSTLNKTVTVTNTGSQDIEEAIPNPSTNLQVNWALVVAKLASVFILATEALTLKTNSTSSPGHTINLAANVPLIWAGAGGDENPFGSTDITTLYVTNASGAAATLYIKTVYDAT